MVNIESTASPTFLALVTGPLQGVFARLLPVVRGQVVAVIVFFDQISPLALAMAARAASTGIPILSQTSARQVNAFNISGAAAIRRASCSLCSSANDVTVLPSEETISPQ